MTRYSAVVALLATSLVTAAFAQTSDKSVVRLDPSLDALISPDAKLELVRGDFGFTEGVTWVSQGRSGYLLFSDIPANVIYKFNPSDGKVSVAVSYSGFSGADSTNVGMQIDNGHALVILLGSNAVTTDPQGRIVYCAHGDHQIVRVEPDGRRTVLASQFEGKRLNSPNDLVFKSDGTLYFTDPPAGLRDGDKDSKKELPFNGVYMLKGSNLQVVIKDMALPNGLAFTPDEKYLYVNDSVKKTIIRYEVRADDTLSAGELFIDMTTD